MNIMHVKNMILPRSKSKSKTNIIHKSWLTCWSSKQYFLFKALWELSASSKKGWKYCFIEPSLSSPYGHFHENHTWSRCEKTEDNKFLFVFDLCFDYRVSIVLSYLWEACGCSGQQADPLAGLQCSLSLWLCRELYLAWKRKHGEGRKVQ